jgi:L-seryl-tRNA(Ser) seleniumtransferase
VTVSGSCDVALRSVDQDPRRRVPRTDVLLADPRLAASVPALGARAVKDAALAAQQLARLGEIPPDAVDDAAVSALPVRSTTLRPVINATGVVIHTNLGRAPLSAAAIAAVATAGGYVDVEYDVRTGRRARRGKGALQALQAAVPPAEDVHVVNNGAAALALAATALAAHQEIVVSRGELIEIGDGFRLPDLLAAAQACLVEVGTTNRTHLQDYADARTPRTAFLLKVHTSNFRQTGFIADVPVEDLATLGVPVVVDIGSGLLHPDPLLPAEPDAASALSAGAALVTASGDKLLGGPQAGLLLGRADLVERLRRHPLARALRVDKLTLAALEATLTGPPPPAQEFLHADPATLRDRAERLARQARVAVVPSEGVVGGGGAPGVILPGWALALPERYAEALRQRDPAVVARLERGRCLLDLRCVPPDQDDEVLAALLAVQESLA